MAFADIRQVHILIETESFYGVFINYSLQISFQRCQLSNGVYYIFEKQKKNSYFIKKSPILLPYVLSIPNRYVKSSTVHHIKPALNLQRVQMTRRNTRSILEVLLRTDKQLINLLHFCLSEVFLQPQILILHVHVCMHVILLYTTCAFQLLDLFLNWDWSIYLADYGQPTSKYIRVKPSDAISLLEK